MKTLDVSTLPKTRKEALELGSPLYYTGKRCKHGHVAPRYTISLGTCTECHIETTARYRARNAEKRRAYDKVYREAKPEKSAERQRRYRKRKPEVRRLQTMKRVATEIRATPPWLTPLHRYEMRAIYRRASIMQKIMGANFDVDHIQPLRGADRRGLHVPWNLQVLPSRENRRKSNKVA
jgi:hypothetical protein